MIQAQSLSVFLQQSRQRIDAVLERWLVLPQNRFDNLMQSMRYSVFNGGKRIRAAMIYAVESELKINPVVSDHIAASIEFMHASSLIHDDLPALDNDDLRRGKAACHIAHGEAMAILAGDALLNLSHQALLDISPHDLPVEIILGLSKLLCKTIGGAGMMGGQAMEFSLDKFPLQPGEIEELYALKTGCLLGAGLQMAVMASEYNSGGFIETFAEYSHHLGLAFQIQDDILDIEGSSSELGKPQFSDDNNAKQTLVQYSGMDAAKQRLEFHGTKARELLRSTGFAFTQLHALTDYIIARKS